jgi:aspartate 1-decarboxylase
MNITMLYSKIHRATVTDAALHYIGSITLDKYLMELAGLVQYQQVDIYNINGGERFHTYVLEGEPHSSVVQINGAAAHLARPGDLVIIAAYADMSQSEAEGWEPKVVFVDADNKPVQPAVLQMSR